MSGSYIYASYLLAITFLMRISGRGSFLQKDNELVIPSLFFALAILVILFGDKKLGSYAAMDTNITQLNLFYMGGSVLAYIVGYSLLGLGRFKSLIIVGFILLVINVLVNVDKTTMTLNLKTDIKEKEGIYLMLGDTFGLWALLACVVVTHRLGRATLVVISLICIAFLNSRTSLYAFITAIPFVYRLRFGRTAVVIVIILAGLLSFAPLLETQDGLIGRMFGSVISGEDSSLNSRMIQFDVGITSLADHWFLGDYGGQIRDFGDFGAYLHNILSYWSQFGLIPFLLIISLWVKATLRAKSCIASDEAWADPDQRFFVAALVFFVVEVFASRSYVYFMAWLALGMSAAPIFNKTPQAIPTGYSEHSENNNS